MRQGRAHHLKAKAVPPCPAPTQAAPQRSARTAGALFVVLLVLGPFSMLYVPGEIVVADDAAATAANLRANRRPAARGHRDRRGDHARRSGDARAVVRAAAAGQPHHRPHGGVRPAGRGARHRDRSAGSSRGAAAGRRTRRTSPRSTGRSGKRSCCWRSTATPMPSSSGSCSSGSPWRCSATWSTGRATSPRCWACCCSSRPSATSPTASGSLLWSGFGDRFGWVVGVTALVGEVPFFLWLLVKGIDDESVGRSCGGRAAADRPRRTSGPTAAKPTRYDASAETRCAGACSTAAPRVWFRSERRPADRPERRARPTDRVGDRAGERLITLTGPPGVGKTRLACAGAARLANDVVEEAALADLTTIRDPELVLPEIRAALGLRAAAGRDPAALAERSRTAPSCVVLDNVEHVLPAAPTVAALLTACPGLRIIATGRERLNLGAEHEFPVEPLAVPPPHESESALDSAALAAVPAVALLVERVRRFDPAFAVTAGNRWAITEICRLLDGLPLAIELAAARLRLYSPAELARLLRHRSRGSRRRRGRRPRPPPQPRRRHRLEPRPAVRPRTRGLPPRPRCSSVAPTSPRCTRSAIPDPTVARSSTWSGR